MNKDAPTLRQSRKRLHLIPWLLAGVFVLFSVPLNGHLENNQQALASIFASYKVDHGFFRNSPDGVSTNCRTDWLKGIIKAQSVADPLKNEDIQRALRCSGEYVVLLKHLYPSNRELAAIALEVRPDAAESWFWVAEIEAGYVNFNFTLVDESNRGHIASLLRNGLAIDPTDGLRWRLLGDVLIEADVDAAIEAYLQSCFNGDPGYNGCLRAGLAAEQVGDIENAIRYYRYSNYEVVAEKASALEDSTR